jgi:transcriptional regulator with XRE-family HTH domain
MHSSGMSQLSSHERVRHWREIRGLSQKELGDRCVPPMPQHKISRIETHATDASVDDLEVIVRALDLTMAEFFGATAEARAS